MAIVPEGVPALTGFAITPGNVNDGRAGGGALPDDPAEVFADSAYRGPVFASASDMKSESGFPFGFARRLSRQIKALSRGKPAAHRLPSRFP